jgi:hypothetical protein
MTEELAYYLTYSYNCVRILPAQITEELLVIDALNFFLIRANVPVEHHFRAEWSSGRRLSVSICTFVLVKQVNFGFTWHWERPISAAVSINQHTSAYASIRLPGIGNA